MQYTESLNLKKPGPDDLADINDLNDNADIIDAKFQSVDDELKSLPNRIGAGSNGMVMTVQCSEVQAIGLKRIVGSVSIPYCMPDIILKNNKKVQFEPLNYSYSSTCKITPDKNHILQIINDGASISYVRVLDISDIDNITYKGILITTTSGDYAGTYLIDMDNDGAIIMDNRAVTKCWYINFADVTATQLSVNTTNVPNTRGCDYGFASVHNDRYLIIGYYNSSNTTVNIVLFDKTSKAAVTHTLNSINQYNWINYDSFFKTKDKIGVVVSSGASSSSSSGTKERCLSYVDKNAQTGMINLNYSTATVNVSVFNHPAGFFVAMDASNVWLFSNELEKIAVGQNVVGDISKFATFFKNTDDGVIVDTMNSYSTKRNHSYYATVPEGSILSTTTFSIIGRSVLRNVIPCTYVQPLSVSNADTSHGELGIRYSSDRFLPMMLIPDKKLLVTDVYAETNGTVHQLPFLICKYDSEDDIRGW